MELHGMTLYRLLVFLHVTGAVGIFAAWGMEAVLLAQLRHVATAGEARRWLRLRARSTRVGPISMLAVLVTGVALLALFRGHQAWAAAALVAVFLIGGVGDSFERRARRHLAALHVGAADGVEHDATAAADVLAASLHFRVAVGVAILGLMTAKPGAAGSLAMLAAGAMAGGAAAAAVGARRRQAAGGLPRNVDAEGARAE
jgi:hypothetical protein